MDGKIVCFCVFLCVVMSSGAPVLQPTPATPEGHQPQHQVLVVKRAALYDRGTGDLPCAGTSFRCPFPDAPALCRARGFFDCHDTDFIPVEIRK